MSCPLRKCQGKRGCLCPSKPPPFIYSKTTNQDHPSLQEVIPVTKTEFKRQSPKYIGETAPDTGPVTRIKNSPKKLKKDAHNSPVKAITAKLPKSDSKLDLAALEEKKEDKNSDEVKNSESKLAKGESKADSGSGNVKINYNHYKKEFVIENGSITADVVDKEYCLTFAFPNCKIHLSVYSPNDFSYEEKGLSAPPLERESPVGTYQDLSTDTVYWVHLEEDQAEREAYEQRQEKFAEAAASKRQEAEDNEAKGLPQTSSAESCSCIEGNPCMDRYGCKDWENRYEVAKKNGWKGNLCFFSLTLFEVNNIIIINLAPLLLFLI
jgi:hypothetical protein